MISFADFTADCACSNVAKWVLRRLSNLFREVEKRFQRSASAFLSRRGAFFHSSKSVFNLSLVSFQFSDSACISASATNFSLMAAPSARLTALAAASAALRASKILLCSSISIGICSTDNFNAARFPTPFRFSTCWRSLVTAAPASDGTIAPLLIRAARSATSEARASNFLTKYASASSGVFPGYEPTAFSPSPVITNTVPSAPTRPYFAGSPTRAAAGEIIAESVVALSMWSLLPLARLSFARFTLCCRIGRFS
ncbi:unannotated protein [freshwater metagenome]|uniref:Unannotated protein n=1 Tax=freshwater metagenome TaxID=449393 RepID=A0A6J6MDE6_9ZZZZ